ncbi:MAG: rhodanese-like domain-containing protein [Deltaproteobacteria bacterium]|nr:rhodanese-like domain-containing protein [Deltaproteobacteria bacterium]
MKFKDKVSVAVVLFLLFLALRYEYMESVRQIPSSRSNENKEALFDGITSSELSRLITNKHEFVLIDVRSSGEYRKGRIPGALSIPFSGIKSKISRYNKSDTIILYCESGPWSRVAYSELKKMGFENIRILINGIVGWKWEIGGQLEK